MKKAFPIILMAIGLVLLGAGFYTANRGYDARADVREELAAQKIVTPEDASIPSVPVTNAKTARSMADIIEVHALEATGGKTYAEMERDDPLRDTAFNASMLRTSLFTSIMAFNVADLVVGLGFMIGALGVAVGGTGVALGGLAIPALARKLHIEPSVAAHA